MLVRNLTIKTVILSARVPLNRNVVPPGYYMFFIIKEDRPPIAQFVLPSELKIWAENI
jgi:hypothetical protein